MSSSTWTPAALSSEARPLEGRCWRAVEAQHHVSTAKLTDTADETNRLEDLIDATKPAVPEEYRHLNYLLFTPFRYGAPYPTGTRFRRPGMAPGVFYASATARTAMTEMAFHRLLFFAESPATPWPANLGEYTAFAVDYAAGRAIDLTTPPFDADRALWTRPADYTACQTLADAAHAADIDVIRYESVRDPPHGINLAILSCDAFAQPDHVDRQSWHIALNARGARLVCEFPRVIVDFDRDAFAADPRIARLKWER
jgi:hypothetical protein